MIDINRLPKTIIALNITRISNSTNAPIASIAACAAVLDRDANCYREGISMYIRVNTKQHTPLSDYQSDEDFWTKRVKKHNPASTEEYEAIMNHKGVVPLYDALLHLNYFIRHHSNEQSNIKVVVNNYDRTFSPIKRAAEAYGIKLFLRLPESVVTTSAFEMFSEVLACPRFYRTLRHHALVDAGTQLSMAAGVYNAAINANQAARESTINRAVPRIYQLAEEPDASERLSKADELKEMFAADDITPSRFSFTTYDEKIIYRILQMDIKGVSYFIANESEYRPFRIDIRDHRESTREEMMEAELKFLVQRSESYYEQTLNSGKTRPFPMVDALGNRQVSPFEGPEFDSDDRYVEIQLLQAKAEREERGE